MLFGLAMVMTVTRSSVAAAQAQQMLRDIVPDLPDGVQ